VSPSKTYQSGNPLYTYDLPPASHWSFRLRRGNTLKLIDIEGGANLAMMFYNPENLLERYNAPDTLKCQHTFKLTQGHCLYSDMGRIFCSITEDTFGWHDTVAGNLNKNTCEQRWGIKSYQDSRNAWQQNGFDSFLVELAKYGLNERDMGANVNFFSKVVVDDAGNIRLDAEDQKPNSHVCLRFEMDTLVVMHSCPHPLDESPEYPRKPVKIEFYASAPVAEDDLCKTLCPENHRGFANNHLYYLGCEK
jgi:uncharacterized protein